MLKRTLEKHIKKVSSQYPVLLLTGPRQVGKTTLLEYCAEKGRRYVTLDDFELRSLAKSDPELFLSMYKPPIIIDEVQYAPELFSYIKMIVDKEQKAGLFWLTGSQKFHLMKDLSESLAGRVAILDMLGMSQSEICGDAQYSAPFLPGQKWFDEVKNRKVKASGNVNEIYKNIWLGSYPKMLSGADKMDHDLFYKSYVQTYIGRDVKDILSISDDLTFQRFLSAIAARTAQMINYSDIARDVDIDHKTVKSWISILETSGLIYILHPYYSNITKRLVKMPKLYFLDTGLCSYLTKWSSPEALEAGAMSGAILETYIFSEILKSYYNNVKTAYFYYYRDADQKEIDLLIEQDNKLYPIEFKKTAAPSQHSFKHFSALNKFNQEVQEGAVICFTKDIKPIAQNIFSIPLEYI